MAHIAHMDIGDIWKPKATFSISGTGVDPTQLTIRIRKPDGTVEVTVESSPASLSTTDDPISRPSTGVFVFHQALDAAGHWYCRVEGVGQATASEDFEVIVDPSPFYSNGTLAANALVDLGELKDWLAETQIDTTDDLRLAQGINAASDRIMAVAGREFRSLATPPETRTFYLDGRSTKVNVGDLATLSSASTSATITSFETGAVSRTLAETDYDGLPYNRKSWEPITEIRFRQSARTSWGADYLLNVTGYWGFPSVPEDIRHATMDAVAYWLDRDVEHFRQDLGTGNIGEAGQTVFLGGSPPTVFPLPPESYRIATSYTRKLVR